MSKYFICHSKLHGKSSEPLEIVQVSTRVNNYFVNMKEITFTWVCFRWYTSSYTRRVLINIHLRSRLISSFEYYLDTLLPVLQERVLI